MRTFVIAEPGCTHEGKLDEMLSLIDMAAAAGADAYKGQWTSDADALCAKRRAPDYRPSYGWLQYPAEWHARLALRCRSRGIQYGCTVYLPEDISVIDEHVSFYKVSAFEAMDHVLADAYLDRLDGNQKRLYVSLGMGASDTFGSKRPLDSNVLARIWPLRCVSAYPAPLESLYLRQLWEGHLLGLSDHTTPDQILTGALAVAAGASVIERHIRLESASPSNPDYAVAMSAHPFTQYVSYIRLAEVAVGDGDVPEIHPSEEPMLQFAWREGNE